MILIHSQDNALAEEQDLDSSDAGHKRYEDDFQQQQPKLLINHPDTFFLSWMSGDNGITRGHGPATQIRKNAPGDAWPFCSFARGLGIWNITDAAWIGCWIPPGRGTVRLANSREQVRCDLAPSLFRLYHPNGA